MISYFEFHCHSEFSRDSDVKIEDIIKKCKKNGVGGIALTDHNEINGALKLRNSAPDWLRVVVGEEIATMSGEIMGLFLNKKIAPGMSVKKTIQEIKNQGGLVVIPHPFDRLRLEKMDFSEVQKYAEQFDIVEVFNARNVFQKDNEKAMQFAKKWNKAIICGSDAHCLSEYGKTIAKSIDCSGPKEFLESLKNATFETHKASILFHLLTKYKKLTKKLKK